MGACAGGALLGRLLDEVGDAALGEVAVGGHGPEVVLGEPVDDREELGLLGVLVLGDDDVQGVNRLPVRPVGADLAEDDLDELLALEDLLRGDQEHGALVLVLAVEGVLLLQGGDHDVLGGRWLLLLLLGRLLHLLDRLVYSLGEEVRNRHNACLSGSLVLPCLSGVRVTPPGDQVDKLDNRVRGLHVRENEVGEELLCHPGGIEIVCRLCGKESHRLGVKDKGRDPRAPTANDPVDERDVDVGGVLPGDVAAPSVAESESDKFCLLS